MITAEQVKELRQLTKMPMMKCKKALLETNGNIDASVEWLRKSNKEKITVKKHTGESTAIYIIAGMIGNQANKTGK